MRQSDFNPQQDMNTSLTSERWQEIANMLSGFSATIYQGEIGVSLRIHNAQIVSVSYSLLNQYKCEVANGKPTANHCGTHKKYDWQSITDILAEKSAGVHYGESSASLRIQNNQIVSVTYSRMEQNRREVTHI